MPDNENPTEKKSPSGWTGFLVRLRESGVYRIIPKSWGFIIMALYSYRNVEGYAWPSQKTLAQACGVTDRTIRNCLKWAKVGLGIKTAKRGRGVSYYLPLNEKIEAYNPSNLFPSKPNRYRKRRTTEGLRPEKDSKP